ncbi:SLATT domain-containing protein [Nocardia nepalensis]|uniref:SLATT domain-containing protein n=1 Tax=Nocardia nepalensis TaxID=3375448 RepID=UPI003B67802D
MAGESGAGVGDRRAMVVDELFRLEESAMYSAQGQFEAAKQWRTIHLLLGTGASILAAVSGAASLAAVSGRTTSGILALAAAAVGAVLTTLNAAHRAGQATSAANAYLGIQTAARQARLVDLPFQTVDEARAMLADLTRRRDDQNKATDPPGRWAYHRGAKNIAAGGQTYAVDTHDGTA